jgi:hypothetical protein
MPHCALRKSRSNLLGHYAPQVSSFEMPVFGITVSDGGIEQAEFDRALARLPRFSVHL